MAAITRDEWNALADEPMTRERYEALCEQFGVAVATDRECWNYLSYEYRYDDGKQPPLRHRLCQLRAVEFKREREVAQTERDRQTLAERQRRNIAAYEAAEREREEMDGGY